MRTWLTAVVSVAAGVVLANACAEGDQTAQNASGVGGAGATSGPVTNGSGATGGASTTTGGQSSTSTNGGAATATSSSNADVASSSGATVASSSVASSTAASSSSTGMCKPDGFICNVDGDCCTDACVGGVCGGSCALQCGTLCCSAGQKCCTPPPIYTCTGQNNPCPVSRRRYKDDIRYLADDEEKELHDELLQFPLARWRYKNDAERAEHVGFILEDVEPSPAADSRHDMVDLYGYTTMAVAAIKEQDRRIRQLEQEMERLRSECRPTSAR